MNLFSRKTKKTCANCSTEIKRMAPVNPREGLDIGMKFGRGEVTQNEMISFYKAIGNNCPSCGKLICSYCFQSGGEKCPSCGSKIKYFS